MQNLHEDKKYPISEIFTSPQGEGVYTGQIQTFIRLAGCTVGKPYPKEMYGLEDQLRGCRYSPPVLPIYTEKCTLYDGREFPCDTDYRVHERLTADEIMLRIPTNVKDVCITGGEPLMHDLSGLVDRLWQKNKFIHLETSGTKDIEESFGASWQWVHALSLWITVSPKLHATEKMLLMANELKILVDGNFKLDRVLWGTLTLAKFAALQPNKPVFLQPVNFENEVNVENLRLCRTIQDAYPQFRISLQSHKVYSHYLKELVR